MKCDSCNVQICANESEEPACCARYMENVVLRGKSVGECDAYEPINEK